MKRTNCHSVLLILVVATISLFGFYSSNAFALPVTYQFSGNVTWASQYTLQSGIALGDNFHGSLTFDPEELRQENDFLGEESLIGREDDVSVFQWELLTGSDAWEADRSITTNLRILIENDLEGNSYDSFRFGGADSDMIFDLHLSDDDSDQLSSLSLPLIFNLSEWDMKYIVLSPPCGQFGAYFRGELTELYRLDDAIAPGPVVPESGTLVLFSAGLLGLAGLRRWKRRS